MRKLFCNPSRFWYTLSMTHQGGCSVAQTQHAIRQTLLYALMGIALSGCQPTYPPLRSSAQTALPMAAPPHAIAHFEKQALTLSKAEEQKLLTMLDSGHTSPIVLQMAPTPNTDKLQSMHLAFKRGEAYRQRLLKEDATLSVHVRYAPHAALNTLEITTDTTEHAN